MSWSKLTKTVTLQQTLRESWPTILVVSASSIFCITYALLQKKFFSREATKVLTRFYFPLTWPVVYFTRKYLKKGSYWSTVDATVFLGAVPLEGFQIQGSPFKVDAPERILLCRIRYHNFI